MSTNPFKNFVAYRVNPILIKQLKQGADENYEQFEEKLQARKSYDPTGGSWSGAGLIGTAAGDELITPIGDHAHLLAVQFNERILPGKVRDEHLAKVVADIEEREGRKCHKKMYAELRQNVEFELLPKAFIRRSAVHVMFVAPHFMFIFASSPKKADDTLAVLRGVFGDDLHPVLFQVKDSIASLTTIATYGVSDPFEATNSIALKGSEKRAIRIKDTDVGSADVQELLKQGYVAHELSMTMLNDAMDDEVLHFSVNDKLIFKRVALFGIDLMRESNYADVDAARQAFHGYAILVADSYRTLVESLVDVMGGEVVNENNVESVAGAIVNGFAKAHAALEACGTVTVGTDEDEDDDEL